jgi:hypothetical protein
MSPAVPAALIGAADNVAFLATRPRLFAERPQRAAGSMALLGLWLAAARSSNRKPLGSGALTLAGILAAANAGLLAAHLRAGVATPRIFAGAGLSGVVLIDVLRRR